MMAYFMIRPRKLKLIFDGVGNMIWIDFPLKLGSLFII